MKLAGIFRDRTGVDAGRRLATDEELEARLLAVVARGRAAHPDLGLDDGAFVEHLARCVADDVPDAVSWIEELEIEDLFLARACAKMVAGAAARFEDRCCARLRTVLAASVQSADLRAEVYQRVMEALLVGSAAAPPKIGQYGGQGALDRWVAVVAQRHAASAARSEASEQRAREGAAVEAALAESPQPELIYAKHLYRAGFEQAITDALAVLSERDRLLLRLHLVSGLSVERIGRMYAVSQASASRWLARARALVSAEVTRLLRQRLRASPDEIASLAGLVASQLDISISRLLNPAEIAR